MGWDGICGVRVGTSTSLRSLAPFAPLAPLLPRRPLSRLGVSQWDRCRPPYHPASARRRRFPTPPPHAARYYTASPVWRGRRAEPAAPAASPPALRPVCRVRSAAKARLFATLYEGLQWPALSRVPTARFGAAERGPARPDAIRKRCFSNRFIMLIMRAASRTGERRGPGARCTFANFYKYYTASLSFLHCLQRALRSVTGATWRRPEKARETYKMVCRLLRNGSLL